MITHSRRCRSAHMASAARSRRAEHPRPLDVRCRGRPLAGDPGALPEEHYRDASIRARIVEYLGGDRVHGVSAAYIGANPPCQDLHFVPRTMGELDRCLDERLEIGRSLWDHEFLLAHLDIEYASAETPEYPFLHADEIFSLQRPVIDAIEANLRRAGVVPLHLISGRGHHFVWQIDQRSDAFDALARLGRLPPSVLGKYDQPLPPSGERIPMRLGQAYGGLGLVLECLLHQVLREASPRCVIPVTLSTVETLSSRHRCEVVALDLTEYGDPLHTRVVRVPFSAYYKPQHLVLRLGRQIAARLPRLFLVPADDLTDRQLLRIRQDERHVREFARRTSVRIPEQSAGTAVLVDEYRRSGLARAHDWFYEEAHDPPERWPCTYDALALDALPPSARRILEQPNDLLLKPACLRHVVHVLLALGWHPRHIAGLIRSKYERDYGWGSQWYLYDAALRADFYCRVFTGLVLTHLDDLSALSVCPPVSGLRDLAGTYAQDLAPFRRSLERRMHDGRLASRPLHGLFL